MEEPSVPRKLKTANHLLIIMKGVKKNVLNNAGNDKKANK